MGREFEAANVFRTFYVVRNMSPSFEIEDWRTENGNGLRYGSGEPESGPRALWRI